jgi:predicted HAD superfamily Cof-like phosphohydrolase
MPKSKKPRKAYKPKAKTLNPLRILSDARPFDQHEVTQLAIPVRAALEAMRTGSANLRDYDTVAAVVNVAFIGCKKIGGNNKAALDVCIEAMHALLALRHTPGHQTTQQQFDAILSAVEIHEQMLELMTPGEIEKTYRTVVEMVDAGKVLPNPPPKEEPMNPKSIRTTGTLGWIEEWHKRACPKPGQMSANVQLGCHLEEVLEMLDAVEFSDEAAASAAREAIEVLAIGLKHNVMNAHVRDSRAFLDALADQIVTAVGVGYRHGMNVPQAVEKVDSSNWTKFDKDGQPIFDDKGKVIKGPDYQAPDLTGLF